jgi:3-(3-hydroxy-phenyl)propionate hydroxylase
VDEIFDVAVVGYRPSGLVAASMLGQAGRRVVVCERWPSLYGLPRLTHIDDETARVVQAAGDVEEAPRDSTPTEYLRVNGRDEQLLRMPVAPVGPMGFPTHISMHQRDIEDWIDWRIRALPNVEVRQGWSVCGLAQAADAVELTLMRWVGYRETRPEERVCARYVIAADGTKTAIRGILAIEGDDFGFNERWLNFDTEWLRLAPTGFRLTTQYCDPVHGCMYMTIGQRRQRFEFALLPGQSGEELPPRQRGFLDKLGCHVVRLGHHVIDEDGVHTAYLRELGAVAYLARPDFVLFSAAIEAAEVPDPVDEVRAALAWAAAPSAVGA